MTETTVLDHLLSVASCLCLEDFHRCADHPQRGRLRRFVEDVGALVAENIEVRRQGSGHYGKLWFRPGRESTVRSDVPDLAMPALARFEYLLADHVHAPVLHEEPGDLEKSNDVERIYLPAPRHAAHDMGYCRSDSARPWSDRQRRHSVAGSGRPDTGAGTSYARHAGENSRSGRAWNCSGRHAGRD